MIEALRAAATVTIDSCVQALLLPNLKAGKTEALLHLIGPESRSLRSAVFSCSEPMLELHGSIWTGARLRLVATYRHLGGLLHVDGSLRAEVKARVGASWQAFRKHRRKVLASPVVGTRDKALLFTTLIESTLYFGVGAWPRVTTVETQKFQATLVAMARNMLRPYFSLSESCHLIAQLVLSSARILSANSAFHIERLKYFRSVVAKASCDLWAILRQEGSWCRSVQSSLQWLHDTLSLAGPPKVQVACWDAAVSFIRDQPLAWKRLVQRGRNLALLRELWDAEVQQYQGMTFRALVLQGAAVPPDVRNEGDTREVCGPCGCIFQGLREWSHHAFKRHGRIKESRKLATGTQCPVCIRQFACNARLCQHLDHSTSCRWALRNSGVSAHPEPGRGSKKYDDKLQPATQASGPAQRWDFTVGVEEKDSPCKEVLSLLEDLFFSGRESITTREDLLRKYRECFGAVCLQRTRLHATAAQWKQEIAEVLEADEDISVSWAAWHSSAAKLAADVDLVAWLAEDAVPTQSSVATFQHATVQLPWLEFHSFVLPTPPPLAAGGTCIVPKGTNVDFSGGFFRRCILHKDCFENGQLLDFGGWSQEPSGGLVFLSCRDLLQSLEIRTPVKRFGDVEGPLRYLRLFSDLVRGVVFFWRRGVPAALVVPPIECPAVAAVTRASPHVYKRNGLTALSNIAIPCGLLSCFTS